MNFTNPFHADFWIEYEPETPVSNVVHFPGVARANAAQAAGLLEQDRSNMRLDLKSDLMRQRRAYEGLIAQIDAALVELSGG